MRGAELEQEAKELFGRTVTHGAETLIAQRLRCTKTEITP